MSLRIERMGVMKARFIFLVCAAIALCSSSLFSQTKFKDFKGSAQRLALIEIYNESAEPSVAEGMKKELIKAYERYTEVLDENQTRNFKLLDNPGNQYFKPSAGDLSEIQAEFLARTGEDNEVDIIVLSSVRESFEGIEISVQLFDARIREKSEIEREVFSLKNRRAKLEELVYRSMNYLDRDGFVNPQPQDFLEKPDTLQKNELAGINPIFDNEAFVKPEDLAPGYLEDDFSIGGDRKPFWEKWWFWTVIGGSLVTAGSLTYYFVVVDQPESEGNIDFNLP